MAAAPAARESRAAPAQQAPEPQPEPARGAEGARGDWDRDWNVIPDPLWGEPLPLVMEVYGWQTSGHRRDHQRVEEPALRTRALPEGRGEPGSTPSGVGGPGGQ